jgi:hypothetical protein
VRSVLNFAFSVQLASEYNVMFYETSAKENIGVDDAFMQMSKVIKRKMDNKVSSIGQSFSRLARACELTQYCLRVWPLLPLLTRCFLCPQTVPTPSAAPKAAVLDPAAQKPVEKKTSWCSLL